ncbi:putative transporter [Candidatus Woesearchaeota archaeon]|nr:putative transporter [Candidatus Woesearchaeota archaeon]
MIKAFFWSKKWFLWAWGGFAFLLLSLYAQVYMSVLFNKWYGRFYDMLQAVEKYSLNDFVGSLFYFTKIAMISVVLGTFTGWFTRKYSLAWREAITFDYIPRWRNVQHEIEGASQRIQEDAYRWARIVESLGLQVVRAVMTLVAFLPILWYLGKGLAVPFIGSGEGNLVWTALIISIGGMVISWFVGIKLPGLEYNNQKVEAAFRKELVLGEDDKQKYCSIPTVTELFTGIKFNYNKLFLHYGYFDLWVYAYDQFMVIVPYLIAGPALFSTAITLGVVVQISNAFGKVHGSFSLFIQNWTTVTELRSIWKRLHEFQNNLDKYNKEEAEAAVAENMSSEKSAE